MAVEIYGNIVSGAKVGIKLNVDSSADVRVGHNNVQNNDIGIEANVRESLSNILLRISATQEELNEFSEVIAKKEALADEFPNSISSTSLCGKLIQHGLELTTIIGNAIPIYEFIRNLLNSASPE